MILFLDLKNSSIETEEAPLRWEEQFLMMLHIRNCWSVEKGWIQDLM